jgi:hemerythrin
MAIIEWNPAFSMGAPALDGQHRRLIELANDILLAVRSGKEPRRIAACFSKIREHTVYHFADEEEFMRTVGYPEWKAHALEHENLRKLVRHHQDKLFREGTVREKDIMAFLKALLVDHVIYSDLGVKRYLVDRNIQNSEAPAA